MVQVAGLAAELLRQLLSRFQRLLFSEALLCALGDALALEDEQGAAPEHAWQTRKRSCIIDILAKVPFVHLHGCAVVSLLSQAV